MLPSSENSDNADPLSTQLKKLTPEQVLRIDELLGEVGDYGEVRLIVQRGELRFINKVESHKA